MSIELYWSDADSHDTPLVVIDESLLNSIAGALGVLERKSGVCVDPYGTTKIAPAHAAILAAVLGENGADETFVLIEVLLQAASRDLWLIAEGD